ncbi:MAG: hypothetical protein ACP5QO_16005 [Clostridia bacterium]
MRAVSLLLTLGLAAVLNHLVTSVCSRGAGQAIVLRCRDQAGSIEGRVRQVVGSGRYEVVYVQDVGSGDETPAILDRLARELSIVLLSAEDAPPAGAHICDMAGRQR